MSDQADEQNPETDVGSDDAAVEAAIAARVAPESLQVRFTPEALSQAERLANETPAYQGLPLRVYIEGKGCDGFYYGVAFDPATEADLCYRLGPLDVVVDPDSFRFIHGSLVTWVDDERGRGFLVENPHQRRYRGKFFKRKSWQERLTGTSANPDIETTL